MPIMRNIAFIIILLINRVEISRQHQTDSRCLLEGGGSTDSFFVREDLAVNSTIGKLRIIGKVGEDVTFRLGDDRSPVRLDTVDNTALLVLTRPLDKEGVQGPSSLTLGIICDRVGSDDPGFTIPINVRVTDVNDNSPKFVSSPYTVNVSELSMVGTVLIDSILAVDIDQTGPFSTVEYGVVAGPFSDYVGFENPLEGKLILLKNLDYEKLKTFEVKIEARDQGSPPQVNVTSVRVRVLDADDQNPAFFFDKYTAEIPDKSGEGQRLEVKPKDVQAFDKDLGVNSPVYYSFSGTGLEYRYFELNRNTGLIYLKAAIPNDEIVQPVTLVIKAIQFDNPDRYAITTLVISREGHHSWWGAKLAFLQPEYSVSVLENTPLNSNILTVVTNKPTDDNIQFGILHDEDTRETDKNRLPVGFPTILLRDGIVTAGGHSLRSRPASQSSPGSRQFSVTGSGEIRLRQLLDYESQDSYNLTVFATNGRDNTTTKVFVKVINVNDWDPRFRHAQYEFYVTLDSLTRAGYKLGSNQKLSTPIIVGSVQVHDADRGDRVTLQVGGPDARAFAVTKQGQLVLVDVSRLIDTNVGRSGGEAHVVITATDSGNPPRRAAVPVVVRFSSKAVRSVAQDSEVAGGLLEGDLKNGPNILLVWVLSVVLVLSVLIITSLTLYICRNRRSYDRTNPPHQRQVIQLRSADNENVTYRQKFGDVAGGARNGRAQPSVAAKQFNLQVVEHGGGVGGSAGKPGLTEGSPGSSATSGGGMSARSSFSRYRPTGVASGGSQSRGNRGGRPSSRQTVPAGGSFLQLESESFSEDMASSPSKPGSSSPIFQSRVTSNSLSSSNAVTSSSELGTTASSSERSYIISQPYHHGQSGSQKSLPNREEAILKKARPDLLVRSDEVNNTRSGFAGSQGLVWNQMSSPHQLPIIGEESIQLSEEVPAYVSIKSGPLQGQRGQGHPASHVPIQVPPSGSIVSIASVRLQSVEKKSDGVASASREDNGAASQADAQGALGVPGLVWSHHYNENGILQPIQEFDEGKMSRANSELTTFQSGQPVFKNPLHPESNNAKYSRLGERSSGSHVSDINQVGLPLYVNYVESRQANRPSQPDSTERSEEEVDSRKMEDNAKSQVQRIEWPRNSISRRVKKLSWEDEMAVCYDRDLETYMTDQSVYRPQTVQSPQTQNLTSFKQVNKNSNQKNRKKTKR